jgi:hypothetical protein
MIKNHTATITGNITSPAARTGDVQKINDSLSGKDPDSDTSKLVNTFVPVDKNLDDHTTIGRKEYDSANVNRDTYVLGSDVYIGSKRAKKTVFRPYYRQGEAIYVPKLYTSGFITSNRAEVCFFIPLSRPIIGDPVITITSEEGFIIRQGTYYTHGSSANQGVKPSSYSITICPGGLSVKATFTDTTNAYNDYTCGIEWSGTITLA